MTKSYNRSEILDFSDLTPIQQANVVSNYFNNYDEAQGTQYVILEEKMKDEITGDEFEHSPLPLSMFMRTGYPFDNRKKLWDGIYSTSAWSAYFIKLSRCGSMAVVADRYF